METSLEIVVRPTEIDVNCHVNNAKYVEYLEWGREDWYERNGLPYDLLLGQGAVTVTVSMALNFRRECRQGEVLTVVTRPERLGRTSFAFRQEVRKADGGAAADAVVTLVTVDPATRKSRPVPDDLARALRSEPGPGPGAAANDPASPPPGPLNI
jgi:YbgC/YbaW family acyl-CoA thioester hydrolase